MLPTASCSKVTQREPEPDGEEKHQTAGYNQFHCLHFTLLEKLD